MDQAKSNFRVNNVFPGHTLRKPQLGIRGEELTHGTSGYLKPDLTRVGPSEVPQGGSIPHAWVHPPTMAPARGPFPGPPLTILGLALALFQPSANPLDACCLTIGLAYISAHAYSSVPHCVAPASPAVHLPGWLARLRRPPPFIRLAGLHGSGVPLRSSAWLACAAPASPSVHLPGWLARLRRPPPFICLAGLHGSGVPLPSSAWLAQLRRPPPFICLGLHGSGIPRRSSAWLACTAPASPSIHLPGLRGSGFLLHSSAFPHKQTLIAYTSSLAGVGLMDMSIPKAKGVCGYIHTVRVDISTCTVD
ncbi:hypothetical protein B0H11DRAFT_1940686 [Mycena galericulata]|nr:hypothetical protein B0H11DRAFT_1940686 [Mycena galericulata]